MLVNRFMWEDVEQEAFRQNKRVRCAVKFENVIKVESKNINQNKILSPSQEISVRIIEINKEKRRISLSYKDTLENPCILVDLAAETGGNIEKTVPGKTITYKQLTLIGTLHLAKHISLSASQMLSKNLLSLTKEITDVSKSRFKEDS